MYCSEGSHSGTLMYGSEGSHSGTLMYCSEVSHSGTLMYGSEGSHSGTLMYGSEGSHSILVNVPARVHYRIECTRNASRANRARGAAECSIMHRDAFRVHSIL